MMRWPAAGEASADHGHARDVRALRTSHGERDDIDVQPAEERGYAGEHTGLVFDVGYECVLHEIFLNVLRGLNQRVSGPADHLVQRRAGHDHRINRIFLLHHEVDQERSLWRARRFDRRHHLGARASPLRPDAVRVSQLDEVRAEKIGEDS